MRFLLVLIATFVIAHVTAHPPAPTPDQLAWSQMELGAIIHLDVATFARNQGCGLKEVPDPKLYNPTYLDTDQWLQSIVDFGAKYAVLVAKHSCGFCGWQTAVRFPSFGFSYQYSVNSSSYQGDVVQSFIESCKKYGVKPGFYYSVAYNSYLNVAGGKVQGGNLAPGQVNVTQDQYEQIALAQLEELWTRYGSLVEIWFDGGYPESLRVRLSALIQKLQARAVGFNGYGISPNPIRWIGTESGHAPYPSWSTTTADVCMNGGSGSADGEVWCPHECDLTLQNGDTWFYDPDIGLHTLDELMAMYHQTVGYGGNMLLDFAPSTEGVLPDDAVVLYRQLGQLIHVCYNYPLASTSGMATTSLLLSFPIPVAIDRFVIQEDQQFGQRIRGYSITVEVGDGEGEQVVASGTAVGNKKIDLLGKRLTVSSVRLIVGNYTNMPMIRAFSVFLCS